MHSISFVFGSPPASPASLTRSRARIITMGQPTLPAGTPTLAAQSPPEVQYIVSNSALMVRAKWLGCMSCSHWNWAQPQHPKRKPCPARAQIIIGFRSCPGLEDSTAMHRAPQTAFTQRPAAGTRPCLWSRVAREYQIDSNSRWRTCGSTASPPSALQFPGSRQLAWAPTIPTRSLATFFSFLR